MARQENPDLSRAWEEVMHKKMNSQDLAILEKAALQY